MGLVLCEPLMYSYCCCFVFFPLHFLFYSHSTCSYHIQTEIQSLEALGMLQQHSRTGDQLQQHEGCA